MTAAQEWVARAVVLGVGLAVVATVALAALAAGLLVGAVVVASHPGVPADGGVWIALAVATVVTLCFRRLFRRR